MQSRITKQDIGRARRLAHSWFDCLWEEGLMTRDEAYAWLAEQLEITTEDCHFSAFDVGMCEAAIPIIEAKLAELRRATGFEA